MKHLIIFFLPLALIFLDINAQDKATILNSSELSSAPVFAQGKMTLNDFLRFYQNYPEEAQKNNITGNVIVTLIISDEGEVIKSNIDKGVEPSLDQEALRLAQMMPNFTPGKKGDANVASRIKLNIPFGTNTKSLKSTTTPTATSVSQEILPTQKFPLYVIDGKIVNEDINVNADNIESVRVIKGAKAIAQYGERASDGVIIFTTKEFPEK